MVARRVAHFTEAIAVDWPDDDTGVFAVRGRLFFASSNDVVYQFDYVCSPSRVVIDLSEAQIYDSSTVVALDAVVTKYEDRAVLVEIIGVNEPSQRWHALCSSMNSH